MTPFTERVLDWHAQHGRTDLPWLEEKSAYRVWVSEIMLQQTQVATVVPYFERFVARFPTVAALASAHEDEVLHLWTGLGYYARARNLLRAARKVQDEHDGELPTTVDGLVELPGIGRSTAGAIAAIAYGHPAPILDGNVKRVLCRVHAIEGYPGETAVEKTLWQLAAAATPAERAGDYTQAIMDLGATVCTRRNPICGVCPVRELCLTHDRGDVHRLPAPRPKRSKPTKAVKVVLLVDPDGAVYLEKRPPQGIWGGLWSAPEHPPEANINNVLADYQIASDDVVRLAEAPVMHHAFTHFKLQLTPVYVWLKRRPALARDADVARWLDLRDDTPLGLSAVTVKLNRYLRAELEGEFALT